jgi:hypothetical protein
MYCRVVRVKVTGYKSINGRLCWDFSPKFSICSLAMRIKEESWTINCGAWFRTSDPFVTLFEILLVRDEIVLNFGDLFQD